MNTKKATLIATWTITGLAMLTLLLGFVFGGCATALMNRTPRQRAALLLVSHDHALRYASQQLTTMGASSMESDPRAQRVSGIVHGAVALTVYITPEGECSRFHITETLLAGKLVLGRVNEADDYITLLQGGPYAVCPGA